jgi:hypothetical protein
MSFDTVNKPKHYNQSGIECIAAIEASMSNEQFCKQQKDTMARNGNIILEIANCHEVHVAL